MFKLFHNKILTRKGKDETAERYCVERGKNYAPGVGSKPEMHIQPVTHQS